MIFYAELPYNLRLTLFRGTFSANPHKWTKCSNYAVPQNPNFLYWKLTKQRFVCQRSFPPTLWYSCLGAEANWIDLYKPSGQHRNSGICFIQNSQADAKCFRCSWLSAANITKGSNKHWIKSTPASYITLRRNLPQWQENPILFPGKCSRRERLKTLNGTILLHWISSASCNQMTQIRLWYNFTVISAGIVAWKAK